MFIPAKIVNGGGRLSVKTFSLSAAEVSKIKGLILRPHFRRDGTWKAANGFVSGFSFIRGSVMYGRAYCGS